MIQRQRKIGFELEDVKWRTWKETAEAVVEGAEGGQQASVGSQQASAVVPQPRFWRAPNDKRGMRPMTKREPLHVGTAFEMQADEYVEEGQLVSDVEFVTDPLPLTENGNSALEGALEGIAKTQTSLHWPVETTPKANSRDRLRRTCPSTMPVCRWEARQPRSRCKQRKGSGWRTFPPHTALWQPLRHKHRSPTCMHSSNTRSWATRTLLQVRTCVPCWTRHSER